MDTRLHSENETFIFEIDRFCRTTLWNLNRWDFIFSFANLHF